MLPDYTVHESARAVHVRFKATPEEGLVVVVPRGFDRRRIPPLLRRKQAWIDRAMAKLERHRAAFPTVDGRPTSIELRAIERSWQLDWRRTADERVALDDVGRSTLRVAGPIDDGPAWRSALRQWLIERGRETLIPWTEGLAEELGIAVGGVAIRCQRSRWGSYSSRGDEVGTISLNAQLLFLPERWARYVPLHELCHAVVPDHSARFWELVRSHRPDVDRLRTELRDGWWHVPAWLHAAE